MSFEPQPVPAEPAEGISDLKRGASFNYFILRHLSQITNPFQLPRLMSQISPIQRTEQPVSFVSMCVLCVHTCVYVCFSFCGSPPLQTIYGMASVRLIRHQSLLDSAGAARWPGEGISRTRESVRRLGLSPTESYRVTSDSVHNNCKLACCSQRGVLHASTRSSGWLLVKRCNILFHFGTLFF